jgi:hypothetical protein
MNKAQVLKALGFSSIKKNTPTPSDLHVNRNLTNVSVAYMQSADNFVADKVFPSIGSDNQSDQYPIFEPADWFRNMMLKRAPSTETPGDSYRLSSDSFNCHIWGLHRDIDDQMRANADSVYQLDAEATQFLSMRVLIAKEHIFNDNFLKIGVWGTDVSGGASDRANLSIQYWDNDSSDPVKDIKYYMTYMQKKTYGMRPNTLIITQKILDVLTEHPDIIDRVKYGQTPGSAAQVELSDIQGLFKIQRILVMGAVENVDPEINTAGFGTPAFIQEKNAWLGYVAPSPGRYTPSAGYTFFWQGYLGVGAQGQRVSRFRFEPIKSDRIEIEMGFDPKVVCAPCGLFIENAISDEAFVS